jgi:hypothetical protein
MLRISDILYPRKLRTLFHVPNLLGQVQQWRYSSAHRKEMDVAFASLAPDSAAQVIPPYYFKLSDARLLCQAPRRNVTHPKVTIKPRTGSLQNAVGLDDCYRPCRRFQVQVATDWRARSVIYGLKGKVSPIIFGGVQPRHTNFQRRLGNVKSRNIAVTVFFIFSMIIILEEPKMATIQCSAVLFDLDGTVFSSCCSD